METICVDVLRRVSLILKELGGDEDSMAALGSETAIKSEDAGEFITDRMIQWSVSVPESFNAKIFTIELIGQWLWYTGGPLAWPLLFLLYGSLHIQ